jgi:hypothetical protein
VLLSAAVDGPTGLLSRAVQLVLRRIAGPERVLCLACNVVESGEGVVLGLQCVATGHACGVVGCCQLLSCLLCVCGWFGRVRW